jgi:epoxyqueuosine reductase
LDNSFVISVGEMSRLAKEAATRAEFDLVGVAAVREPDFAELGAFSEWIEAGYAGEMKYLEKRTESGELRRASIKNAAPWARSVIVCGMNYNADQPYSTQVHDPDRGWISRYAWSRRDYHELLLQRLQQVEAALRNCAELNHLGIATRSYVDTGPVVERVYAKYAGIGWIGKNTCIINQKLGSWIFLGVVLTSLDLLPDSPAADRCGSCTRCIDACPTHAILAPGRMDARRCIAYLTIEKRGEIPPELRSGIGHQVFGCDICQDVCPWNTKPGNAPPAAATDFHPQEDLVHPNLKWLAAMSEEDFRNTFRGSPVKRAKFSGLRRNLAVAMGNSGNRAFIPQLETMACDPDPVVAEHARWALKQLGAE